MQRQTAPHIQLESTVKSTKGHHNKIALSNQKKAIVAYLWNRRLTVMICDLALVSLPVGSKKSRGSRSSTMLPSEGHPRKGISRGDHFPAK